MTMHSRLVGARAVIALTGELDLASVDDLDAEVDRLAGAPGVEQVVIDLRELAFMDSSGLRSIVLADVRLRERDKQFGLVRGPETVHRVFEITRMHERFTYIDDPAELEDAA